MITQEEWHQPLVWLIPGQLTDVQATCVKVNMLGKRKTLCYTKNEWGCRKIFELLIFLIFFLISPGLVLFQLLDNDAYNL